MATRKKTTRKTAPKADRLSEAGRRRIRRAAKKRWLEYRAAVARCDWRTARRLGGRPVSEATKKAAKARRKAA